MTTRPRITYLAPAERYTSRTQHTIQNLYANTSEHRKFPCRTPPHTQFRYAIYSSSSTLVSAGNKLAAISASLLTTLSILVLRFVPSINPRLGLIILFTFLFSSTLAFMCNPRRAELFGASAAFAAVRVVFVGSVGTGNGTESN